MLCLPVPLDCTTVCATRVGCCGEDVLPGGRTSETSKEFPESRFAILFVSEDYVFELDIVSIHVHKLVQAGAEVVDPLFGPCRIHNIPPVREIFCRIERLLGGII